MVTSAAGSPRSRASLTAANTSWFISTEYMGEPLWRRNGCRHGQADGTREARVDQAHGGRLSASQKDLRHGVLAERCGQLPRVLVDLGGHDAVRHLELHAAAA